MVGILHRNAGIWGSRVRREIAVEVFEVTGSGNHGGIVGGEKPFGNESLDRSGGAEIGYSLTHTAVCSHTATNCHSLYSCSFNCTRELIEKNVNYRGLERSSQVGLIGGYEVRIGLEAVAQSVEK